MKVTRVKIIIERDPMTKIPKVVAPWEVPIFRSQYGDSKVEILGEQEVMLADDEELPEAKEEYFRLRQQFGIDPDTKQSHADLVYGRGQDGIDKLEKAINASKKGDLEDVQKVVDGKGKLDPATQEAREKATRDPLEDEFANQSNADLIGAAAGGPGDVTESSARDAARLAAQRAEQTAIAAGKVAQVALNAEANAKAEADAAKGRK